MRWLGEARKEIFAIGECIALLGRWRLQCCSAGWRDSCDKSQNDLAGVSEGETVKEGTFVGLGNIGAPMAAEERGAYDRAEHSPR